MTMHCADGPLLDMATTQGHRRISGCVDPEHQGINLPAYLIN
jgi:hypothetical protein